MNSMMGKMDKSEKFWDNQAKDFTDQEQHTQLSENKDFITTLKYLNINDTVLDYGCATGIISNAIADKVKEIHAIDISSKMIEIAKRKANEYHIEKAVQTIAGTDDSFIKSQVDNKVKSYLINIESIKPADLEKEPLPASFQGLPKQFHPFLIDIIKNRDKIRS